MSNLNDLNSLWRLWTIFDPRLALGGLAVFLFTLAVGLHLLVLNTPRFNWIGGPHAGSPALQYLPPTVK